jgi:hypothetical protein
MSAPGVEIPVTQTWAYIGELGPEGRLDWDGSWDGNIPAKGALPDLGPEAWRLVLRLVSEGLWEGRQTDWGAYALRVNGPRLIAFLTEAYGATAIDQARFRDYRALALDLGADRYVALVAAEL